MQRISPVLERMADFLDHFLDTTFIFSTATTHSDIGKLFGLIILTKLRFCLPSLSLSLTLIDVRGKGYLVFLLSFSLNSFYLKFCWIWIYGDPMIFYRAFLNIPNNYRLTNNRIPISNKKLSDISWIPVTFKATS